MATKTNPYQSDLIMGDMYKESGTGIEGKLTSVHFYEHACERATIRYLDKDGNVQEASFDAPELEHVESGEKPQTKRPGGPARAEGGRGLGRV